MKFYVIKNGQHYLKEGRLDDYHKSYSMTLNFEKAMKFNTYEQAFRVVRYLNLGEIYEVELKEKKLEFNQVSK